MLIDNEDLLELQRDPKYAEELDERDGWGCFCAYDWKSILCRYPQFIDRCKCLEHFNCDIWYAILKDQPTLFEKAKEFDEGWIAILEIHPELAHECDKWETFEMHSIVFLLKKYPQLEEIWDKYNLWDKMDNWEWKNLLPSNPQYTDKCNRYNKWHKMSVFEWECFLHDCPQYYEKAKEYPSGCTAIIIKDLKFGEQFDRWDELSADDWYKLLKEHPQFADKCKNWDFSKISWIFMLEEQPQFADKCTIWDKFDVSEWIEILEKHPQFADKCKVWKNFKPNEWVKLLLIRPSLADECKIWKNFTTKDWNDLLLSKPQFADKCDKLDKIDDNTWGAILRIKPEYAEKYKGNYRLITSSVWVKLLSAQPQFADKCKDWGRIRSAKDWIELLSVQPQLIDKCTNFDSFDSSDWKKIVSAQPTLKKYNPYLTVQNIIKNPAEFETCKYLNCFSVENWGDLLAKCPQFIEKCDKLYDDYFPWRQLIEKQPQLWVYSINDSIEIIAKDQSKFDECKCLDKFSTYDWADFILECPQIIDKCDLLDKFTPKDLNHLLIKQPQLADKFDWENIHRQYKKNKDKEMDPSLLKRIIYICDYVHDDEYRIEYLIGILIKQPQLAKFYTDGLFDEFSKKGWNKLERTHPGVFTRQRMFSNLRKIAKPNKD